MTNTVDITNIERGTNWVTQFAFYTGRHVIDGLATSHYADQKRKQAIRDTEALLSYLYLFVSTGDLAHLADYRGRLEVMLDEVDRGAWHAIVAEGAR